MRKILLFCILVAISVYGAGIVDSAEILPQKAEYSILRLVANGGAYQAPQGAILGVDGTKIYGNTGCNGYFGDIKRVGSGDVEINIVGSTRMLCDEVANKFERVLLQNLAGRFSVSEDSGAITLNNDKVQIEIRQ